MRPVTGETSSSGSPPRTVRKSSVTGVGPGTTNATPSSFFMASESMLDAGQTPTASMSDTTFGIRSIADESIPDDILIEREEGKRRSTIIASRSLVRDASKDSLSMGSFESSSSENSSPSRAPRQRTDTTDTVSRGPLVFQSPVLTGSIPSSPKSLSASSFRSSDDVMLDDRNSEAIASDSEDDGLGPATMTESRSPQQFIMPSIMMPSRRPFSSKGNALGRLKILLAGGSGVGKTSLIKSIVQTCDDIVHIDASIPTTSQTRTSKKSKVDSKGYNRTKQISETYASTKAYPAWWSDLEESSVFRRRKSGDGTVLERNICFIDTPGYDSGTSILEGMDVVLRYIESQMAKSLDVSSLDDSETMSLLGGNGGSQVDVVLYLLSHPLKPADLEFIKQLTAVANVVPILARADTVSLDAVGQIKASIVKDLASAELKTFPLSPQGPSNRIYTVCSSPSKDLENMDASLLMQSNYVQPLHQSELPSLIEHLFHPDTIRKLKHFAAKKTIQNRQTPRTSTIVPSPFRTTIPTYPRSATAPSTTIDFFRSNSQALTTRPAGTMTYNQSAVMDHTIREERLARIHLANWASNLQRSLANERARYEAISRAERAEWLKARLGECVLQQDVQAADSKAMTIRSMSKEAQSSEKTISPDPRSQRTRLHDPADPLGLLRWRDELGTKGLIFLKVMGSAGFVGALGTFLFFTFRHWNDPTYAATGGGGGGAQIPFWGSGIFAGF